MLGRHEAEAFSMPSFPILTVRHPLATLPAEEIGRIGAGLAGDVVRILTETGEAGAR